jgi:Cys-tRNA(Pro)/Cys-tRNA(Cys) deacylase
MKPNNVTRMLDARGVPYTAYELPKEKLGAVEAAEILGVPAELVYKTIVVTREGRGKPILALVPGPGEVDLKALAKALGEKKLTLPTQRRAEQLTALQAGGISPLALLNRGFQVVLDTSAQNHSEIYISAGQRGVNIRLPTSALISLTKASLADITILRT